MKYVFYQILLFLVVILGSCQHKPADYNDKRSQMLCIRKAIKDLEPVENYANEIDSLAAYFSKYGTSNDKVIALYNLAVLHYDTENRESAYKYALMAQNCIDESASDYDADTHLGVLSILLHACDVEGNRDAELHWAKEAYRIAPRYPHVIFELCIAHLAFEEKDSCKYYMKQLITELQNRRGQWDNNDWHVIGAGISMAALIKDTLLADKFMIMKENYPKTVSQVPLTYSMCQYYMLKNDTDRIIDYYRQIELDPPSATGLESCRTLAEIYKIRQEKDSATFYFEKGNDIADTLMEWQKRAKTMRIDHATKIEAYETYIKRAEKQRTFYTYILVLLSFMFVFLSVRLVRIKRLHKEAKMRAEKLKKIQIAENLSNFDEIIVRIRQQMESKRETTLSSDLHLLTQEFRILYPKTVESLDNFAHNTTNRALLVCALSMGGFGQQEIATILKCDRQSVYRTRRTISENLCGTPLSQNVAFINAILKTEGKCLDNEVE